MNELRSDRCIGAPTIRLALASPVPLSRTTIGTGAALLLFLTKSMIPWAIIS